VALKLVSVRQKLLSQYCILLKEYTVKKIKFGKSKRIEHKMLERGD